MPADTPKTPLDMLSQMMSMGQGAMSSAMVKPQAMMMEAMLRQNIEALDFLRARLEGDRQLVARLAQAKDPTEAMSLWSEFLQRMMTDYSSETTRLAASATEIAEKAVRAATEEGATLAEALKPKS
jgi:hypothetical protein